MNVEAAAAEIVELYIELDPCARARKLRRHAGVLKACDPELARALEKQAEVYTVGNVRRRNGSAA